MGDKFRTNVARPATPPDSFPGNGLLIESPDSWRKIRETGAMVDREDVSEFITQVRHTARRHPKDARARSGEDTDTCDDIDGVGPQSSGGPTSNRS